MKHILLVEPDFPISTKSKNHSNFLPIGLLKLATYYRNKGHVIKLVRGNERVDFIPDEIMITSLFTYWSGYVKESVLYYRNIFPKSKIIVGGIYATLMPDHCKEYTGCDSVFSGIHKSADKLNPAYDLVNVDYQIVHAMRGCNRRCSFCGIWRLEDIQFKNAKELKKEIKSNQLIFYDNNMLSNPNIEEILIMLSEQRYNDRVINCECQSGFDGRILEKNPQLALLLKKGRFKNIRLAWDFAYEEHERVENWIELLQQSGYKNKEIFIFMIYNWKFDFTYMEKKRKKCFDMGVQISDCRYRPLDQTYDNYNPQLSNQTNDDYFIHPLWSDREIKLFRKNVRIHNICIRYNISLNNYKKDYETLYSKKNIKQLI